MNSWALSSIGWEVIWACLLQCKLQTKMISLMFLLNLCEMEGSDVSSVISMAEIILKKHPIYATKHVWGHRRQWKLKFQKSSLYVLWITYKNKYGAVKLWRCKTVGSMITPQSCLDHSESSRITGAKKITSWFGKLLCIMFYLFIYLMFPISVDCSAANGQVSKLQTQAWCKQLFTLCKLNESISNNQNMT